MRSSRRPLTGARGPCRGPGAVRLVMGRRVATQLALVGPCEPMGELGLPVTFTCTRSPTILILVSVCAVIQGVCLVGPSRVGGGHRVPWATPCRLVRRVSVKVSPATATRDFYLKTKRIGCTCVKNCAICDITTAQTNYTLHRLVSAAGGLGRQCLRYWALPPPSVPLPSPSAHTRVCTRRW